MTDRTKLPVLLTGIGGGGHGEQILKALRLSGIDLEIIGTDTNTSCAHRGNVDHFETLPLASDPSYLQAVTDLADRFGAKAIFHGSEPEMRVLSHAKKDLAVAV